MKLSSVNILTHNILTLAKTKVKTSIVNKLPKVLIFMVT